MKKIAEDSIAWQENINKSIAPYHDNSYDDFKKYERFRFVTDKMSGRIKDARTFLDIGCGKGEFIYCLKEKYPHVRFTGLEYSDELLAMARREPLLKEVEFFNGDAADFDLKKYFDMALMSGVLAIFDDFAKPLERMAAHLNDGGYGYIFGAFNEDDIDVLVRWRNNVKKTTFWESGLNNFSLNTVKKELRKYADDISVHRFQIGIDIKKVADPVRSYTLMTSEKGRVITNGGNVITDFYLIEFRKRPSEKKPKRGGRRK